MGKKYNNKTPYYSREAQQYHIARQQAIDDYKRGDTTFNKDDFNKFLFRNLCSLYIQKIRSVSIPRFQTDTNKTAVLVEFRVLPHIEFIIRNTILKLGPSWSFTIVCGQYNQLFIHKICSSISDQIKIINTPIKNMTPKEYSLFLTSNTFWNLFDTEKILIYQEDSCIFNTNVDRFLKWDYIGAPFEERSNSFSVGNGGLSIRSRSIMLKVIAARPSLEERIMTYNNKRPEDVYFCRNMINYKIGSVADWDEAFCFSTENFLNVNSFGGHQFWKNDPKWIHRMTTLMDSFYTSPPPFITHFTFPVLFNKYILNISDPSSHIQYKLTTKPHTFDNVKHIYICAIHCYDLNHFDRFFSTILQQLIPYFTIIVSYVILNNDIIHKYLQHFTFILIPNFGMDIGSKFAITSYLHDNNIPYKYIFFIHSKTNDLKRAQYIKPFLSNIQLITQLMDIHFDNNNDTQHIGAFFNNSWLDVNDNISKNTDIHELIQNTAASVSSFSYSSPDYASVWGNSRMYVTQLLQYYNLPINIGIFNEGNFYILHRNITEKLFTSKTLYNILNSEYTFDYEWVNKKYNLNDHVFNVYNKFKQSNGTIYCNHLATQMKLHGLSDHMVEHAFERIIMLFVKYYANMHFHILNS